MTPMDLPTYPAAVAAPSSADAASAVDRRFESRQPVACDLWMIDHHGSTVLRCRCLEASRNGMRLRVPLGYGVAEGQRYELRSQLPGSPRSSTFGVIGTRWATVVRTRFCIEEDEDHLDIGVVLDTSESPLRFGTA